MSRRGATNATTTSTRQPSVRPGSRACGQSNAAFRRERTPSSSPTITSAGRPSWTPSCCRNFGAAWRHLCRPNCARRIRKNSGISPCSPLRRGPPTGRHRPRLSSSSADSGLTRGGRSKAWPDVLLSRAAHETPGPAWSMESLQTTPQRASRISLAQKSSRDEPP
jgi:hypothetical protein